MTAISDLDYGTPARAAERTVTLTVDGMPVSVPEGTSVLRAAAEAGLAALDEAARPPCRFAPSRPNSATFAGA